MKKAIKIFISLMVVCFSYSLTSAQEFSHFNIEKGKSAINILPNFEESPDKPARLYPENKENYSKAAFIKQFPDLFEKVESRLDEKDILVTNLYFDEKGNVIYIRFYTWENVLPKLTDELLLEIYNSFKTVEVDKIVDQWKEDISGKMGTLETFFKGKSN